MLSIEGGNQVAPRANFGDIDCKSLHLGLQQSHVTKAQPQVGRMVGRGRAHRTNCTAHGTGGHSRNRPHMPDTAGTAHGEELQPSVYGHGTTT